MVETVLSKLLYKPGSALRIHVSIQITNNSNSDNNSHSCVTIPAYKHFQNLLSLKTQKASI